MKLSWWWLFRFYHILQWISIQILTHSFLTTFYLPIILCFLPLIVWHNGIYNKYTVFKNLLYFHCTFLMLYCYLIAFLSYFQAETVHQKLNVFLNWYIQWLYLIHNSFSLESWIDSNAIDYFIRSLSVVLMVGVCKC